MKRFVTIAIVATAALAHGGDREEAESARMRMDEAREKMAEARAIMDEAAREVAAAMAANMGQHGPDRAFLGIAAAGQDEGGIRIGGVSPGGGAAKAGVKAEDVIVAIDEESLLGDDRPLEALRGVLEDVDPGEIVQLTVLRDGVELRFDVTTTQDVVAGSPHRYRFSVPVGRSVFRWSDDGDVDFDFEFPKNGWAAPGHWQRRDGLLEALDASAPGGARHRLELQLADIGEDLGEYFGVDAGVLVLDTPAKSELKPGDILRRIDGAAVSSAEDAYRLLGRLEQDAQAEVRRKNRKTTVNVAASAGIRVEAGEVLFINDDDEEEHEEEDKL